MTQPTTTSSTAPNGPADEVVRLCQELIRIDSTNFGDGSGPGEREAADYVVAQLREVGLEPTVVESEPGRTSVVVRLEGADRSRDWGEGHVRPTAESELGLQVGIPALPLARAQRIAGLGHEPIDHPVPD